MNANRGPVRLLYTPEQAAEALGVSRTTLFELIRAGRLASVRIGTARRVPVDVLVAFVDELRAAEFSGQPERPPSSATSRDHQSPQV